MCEPLAMFLRGARAAARTFLLAAVAALSGCNDGVGDGDVPTVDNLATIGQIGPFCCRIPEGEAAVHVGSVAVDPASRTEGLLPPGLFSELGFAISDVTPANALEFRWDGWFVATRRERPPTAIPDPSDPPQATLFNVDEDVGGFSAPPGLAGLGPELPYRLYVYARHCGFEEASFTLTVFEYELVTELPTGEPLIRILSRQPRRVTVVNDPSLCAEPAPPSDLVVYSARAPGGSGEIWVADLDGNGTRLTDDAFDDVDPAWSPDRQRIAFASNRGGLAAYELCTMDADGSDIAIETLFDDKWVDDPAWSPDGREVAMTVALPGMPDTDVWVLDLDGPVSPTNPRRLTSGLDRDLSPTWSPDGSEIAFVRNGDVLVVPADGSAAPVTRLAGMAASAVDWSPQGVLALERYDQDLLATRIWKADAATGQNAVRVSDGVAGFSDLTPAWSRDGLEIAFVRRQDFVEEPPRAIHLMGPDGSNRRPLGEPPGDNRDPDW